MARRKYVVRPMGMIGISAQLPKLHTPSEYGVIRYENTNYSYNFRTTHGRAKKRGGYINHNTSTGVPITMGRYTVRKDTLAAYPNTDFNFWMTSYDFCQDLQSTHASHNTETFQYATETGDYDDSIEGVVGDTVYADGTVTFQTDGVAAGDYFILDDDHTSDTEPDTNWAEIESVDSETQLTLTASYTGTTSAASDTWDGSEKSCLIRKRYTGPGTNGSWKYCVVNDILIFCNENDNVQKFAPSDTYASALDSTNALKWHHCIEYANRCVLANEEGVDAISVKWSKENDPTDWTDNTAGSASLQTSAEEITGLGKIGSYLIVFTPTSMLFGYRTGVSTSPIAFQDEKVGVGAYAPNSIVHANGTVYFIGRHNFYKLEGMHPVPIGDAIRDELFSNVAADDLQNFKGFHNTELHEIWWFESHTQWVYAYNYMDKVWNYYIFSGDSIYLHSGGIGLKELNDKEEVSFLGVASSDLSTTTKTVRLLPSSSYDNTGNAVAAQWISKETDFSDKDPKALNRWKTIYRMRLIYKDVSKSMSFTFKIRPDGGSVYSVGVYSDNTNTDTTQTVDITYMIAGNFFSFGIYNSSTTHLPEIVGLEIYYELGGEYFEI